MCGILKGGFCISPQKGAVGSFRRRGRQITGRFQAFAAQDGVSQGTRCGTSILPCRKSRLTMSISWHLRYSETPNTRPILLMHLFEGSCKPPISRRWPKPSSCGRITGTITSRVCLARMDDRVIETAGDPSSPEDDILTSGAS